MQASFNLSWNIPLVKDRVIIADTGSQINSFISLYNFVGLNTIEATRYLDIFHVMKRHKRLHKTIEGKLLKQDATRCCYEI